MKKTITWVIAGLFALSLQGAVWAQKEGKAPEAVPPAEATTPTAPAEQAVTPEKTQQNTQKKAQKKSKKKVAKKKSTKKAKKKPTTT
ncbi:MAG: hypothetical protein ACUVXF_07755 [Desulfobaccales bacterium]